MRFSQFLLLIVVAVVACCSTFATAEERAQITTTQRELANGDRRFLKGGQTTAVMDPADEERIGASTPSFGQYLAFFRLPRFQSLSNLSLVKQLAAVRAKFGRAGENAFLAWRKFLLRSNKNSSK
ncbi:unnamed protein product [Phytophthora lilii]|uniref:RxLR effector protein n=1 Tax=Phytophthora lilii TaxID=2077276 RepID=A0A9W6TG61_9STRA|nr:unnamed protein product [Phytophthora lilii]